MRRRPPMTLLQYCDRGGRGGGGGFALVDDDA
jgi:hypothetical protein